MNTPLKFHKVSIFLLIGLLALALAGLCSAPARAKVGVVPPRYITTDTTWTEASSPYLIDSFVFVNPGVTLTIEPGVEIDADYTNGDNYLFTVEGTLLAQGTAEKPITFHNTLGNGRWSGIMINGSAGNINQGSILDYVIVDGGGLAGTGVGGNLVLQYSQVDVHHCQFMNSFGDGILGDDYTAGGVANVYDSSFMANRGYAIYFQNGVVNPILSNLTAAGNGIDLPYGGNVVFMDSGTLTGEHHWEYTGLPYLILQTIVAPNAYLFIEPGVQVLAYPGNDNLDVQGTLTASGTPSQVIHFDPIDQASGWSGIAIMGTQEHPSAAGFFDNISITKGGYAGNCDLYVIYGTAGMSNSQVDSSEDSGVCLDHGATLVMTGTQLTNNQKFAMDLIDAGASLILKKNLSASGNMSNSIGVEGGNLTGVHNWSKSGINTYDLFYGGVTVAPTGTLNIDPGVTLLFGETRDLTVYGTLNALGTPTEPIIFSGETPTPGLWAGVKFWGTAEQPAVGRLAYATFEYAGYGGGAMIEIDNADVTFQHCILRNCAQDAIKIIPPAQNLTGALAAALTAQPVRISWSQLLASPGYAINNSSTQAVQATYNWWGDASGPQAEDHPGGAGSAVNGAVYYTPYLTAPNQMSIFLPWTIK